MSHAEVEVVRCRDAETRSEAESLLRLFCERIGQRNHSRHSFSYIRWCCVQTWRTLLSCCERLSGQIKNEASLTSITGGNLNVCPSWSGDFNSTFTGMTLLIMIIERLWTVWEIFYTKGKIIACCIYETICMTGRLSPRKLVKWQRMARLRC